MKLFKLYLLTIILTVKPFDSFADINNEININKFTSPFCMIGNGNSKVSFKKKLNILKRYQRKISRKSKHFRMNKKIEETNGLRGSPKWIVKKYLSHRKFNKKEIDFAYFLLTLFAEAKNQDYEGIEMVARVIHNRKEDNSYEKTVTSLAQFSSWYYKNQGDNVQMLCPNPRNDYGWKKVLSVAIDQYKNNDEKYGSTHYFAPKNMVPRYRIPAWAKGNHVIVKGDHLFIVSEDKKEEFVDEKVFFIPKKAKKVKIMKDSLKFNI